MKVLVQWVSQVIVFGDIFYDVLLVLKVSIDKFVMFGNVIDVIFFFVGVMFFWFVFIEKEVEINQVKFGYCGFGFGCDKGV